MDAHYYSIKSGEQIAILICGLVFPSLTITALSLRFAARFKSQRAIHWSDCLALAAGTCTVSYWVVLLIDLFAVGQGTQPVSDIVDPNLDLKYQFILSTIWLVTVYLVKVAILGLYTTVFTLPITVQMIKGIMVFTILCGLASVIPAFVMVRPLRAWWQYSGTLWTETDQIRMEGWSIFLDSATCGTDFIIFFIPLKLLWTLRMERRRKIGLLCAFGFGLITCGMTLTRAVIPTRDLSETGVLLINGAEPSLGTIAACLPLLHPLLGHRDRHDTHSGSQPQSRATGGVRMNTFHAMRRKYGAGTKSGRPDPDKDLFVSLDNSTVASHRRPSLSNSAAPSGPSQKPSCDPLFTAVDGDVFNRAVSWEAQEVRGSELAVFGGAKNQWDSPV